MATQTLPDIAAIKAYLLQNDPNIARDISGYRRTTWTLDDVADRVLYNMTQGQTDMATAASNFKMEQAGMGSREQSAAASGGGTLGNIIQNVGSTSPVGQVVNPTTGAIESAVMDYAAPTIMTGWGTALGTAAGGPLTGAAIGAGLGAAAGDIVHNYYADEKLVDKNTAIKGGIASSAALASGALSGAGSSVPTDTATTGASTSAVSDAATNSYNPLSNSNIMNAATNTPATTGLSGFSGAASPAITESGASTVVTPTGSNAPTIAATSSSPLTTAALVVSPLLSTAASLYAADKAADATDKASKEKLQSQTDTLDYLKGIDKLPMEYRDKALTQLGAAYGLGTPEEQKAFMTNIKNTPMYQSIMSGQSLGEESILRNASATGGLRSGNTNDALYRYNTQLNNQALTAGLQGLTGMAQLPLNTTNIANTMTGMGDTRAAGITGAATAQQAGIQGVTNAIGTGVQNYLYAKGQGVI